MLCRCDARVSRQGAILARQRPRKPPVRRSAFLPHDSNRLLKRATEPTGMSARVRPKSTPANSGRVVSWKIMDLPPSRTSSLDMHFKNCAEGFSAPLFESLALIALVMQRNATILA